MDNNFPPLRILVVSILDVGLGEEFSTAFTTKIGKVWHDLMTTVPFITTTFTAVYYL